MYEHSTNHSNHSWIAHANGVIRMLELRGPSRIDNGLEKAILRAEVGNIFINALRDGTPCFLANKGWRDILFPESLFTSGKATSAFTAIIDIGIFLPGLLEQYQRYKMDACIDLGTGPTTGLVIELRDAHRRALEWQLRYDPDLDGLEQPVDAQSDRLTRAAKISFSTFLMLLLYMLLDVSNDSNLPHDLKPDILVFVVGDEAALSPHVARFQELSARVRCEVEALTAEDTLAAANTVWLMEKMLETVLNVPQGPSLEEVRSIMQDLLNNLDHALEPMRGLSRTGSRAPTASPGG